MCGDTVEFPWPVLWKDDSESSQGGCLADGGHCKNGTLCYQNHGDEHSKELLQPGLAKGRLFAP